MIHSHVGSSGDDIGIVLILTAVLKVVHQFPDNDQCLTWWSDTIQSLVEELASVDSDKIIPSEEELSNRFGLAGSPARTASCSAINKVLINSEIVPITALSSQVLRYVTLIVESLRFTPPNRIINHNVLVASCNEACSYTRIQVFNPIQLREK